MTNIDDKLKSRKSDYGDYGDGLKLNVAIMEMIDEYHHNLRGMWLTPLEKIMINDIVTKLCRIAATPDHLDSWEDISGYGRRISEYYGGLQNATEIRTTEQEVASDKACGEITEDEVLGASDFNKSDFDKRAQPCRVAKICPGFWTRNMGAKSKERLHSKGAEGVPYQDVQRASFTDSDGIYWIDIPDREPGSYRRYTFTEAQINEFFSSLHRGPRSKDG